MTNEDKNIFLNIGTDKVIEPKNKSEAKSILENELAMAIENHDVDGVLEYLSNHRLPKTAKGMRLSSFAFTHFNENIMDALIDKGMPLLYVDSLCKIAANHGKKASEYFVNIAYKDKIKPVVKEIILKTSVENNDTELLQYLLDDVIDRDEDFYCSVYNDHNIMRMAVNERKGKLLSSMVRHLMKKESANTPSNPINSLNFRYWCFSFDFSYSDLSFMQGVYKKDSEVKKYFDSKFPFSMKMRVGDAQIKDMIDLVVVRAGRAFNEMVLKDEYKSIIYEKISKAEKMHGFSEYAKADTAKALIKNIPKICEWRDEGGNNIAHYLMVRNKTQTLANAIYSAGKQLLVEPNNEGKTPLSYLDFEFKTKMEKKIINRGLFDSKLGKRQMRARDNAKKRVM